MLFLIFTFLFLHRGVLHQIEECEAEINEIDPIKLANVFCEQVNCFYTDLQLRLIGWKLQLIGIKLKIKKREQIRILMM